MDRSSIFHWPIFQIVQILMSSRILGDLFTPAKIITGAQIISTSKKLAQISDVPNAGANDCCAQAGRGSEKDESQAQCQPPTDSDSPAGSTQKIREIGTSVSVMLDSSDVHQR